jgi:hypothetical protein
MKLISIGLIQYFLTMEYTLKNTYDATWSSV